MKAIEFALEKEKLSGDYYLQLAKKSTSKGLAGIFNMLANEEKNHYEVIEQMKDSAPPTLRQATVLEDAQKTFETMRQSAESFNFDTSQVQLYEKARSIEEKSEQFYLEKARQTEDPGLKDFFCQLAVHEHKHLILMENIVEFVSRPKTWLENAEFCHLQEY